MSHCKNKFSSRISFKNILWCFTIIGHYSRESSVSLEKED